MTLSLPANRRTGHVILGLDRLTSYAAQMDREPELKSSGAPLQSRSWQLVASGTLGLRRPSPRWRGKTSSGPGRGQYLRWGYGYRATPDPDPVYLYTDDVIGILPPASRRRRNRR